MTLPRFMMLISCLSLAMPTAGWADPGVSESARSIPIAYDVDVVVVGGGTGAVSAAVAAAEQGASVFLAAPHPYLGDDMTATLRLWLEEGEVPDSELAKRLFNDPTREGTHPNPNRIELSYQVDVPSQDVHRDTNPPSLLSDGRAGDAASQSVQYANDATVTADLKRSQPISEVRLTAYRRASGVGGSNFDVQSVAVAVSEDGKTWKPLATIEHDKPTANGDAPFVLSAAVDVTARYVKFSVKKRGGLDRMLLGEIEVIGPAPAKPGPSKQRPPAPRPMHIKKTLDEVLIQSGVKFLYSCLATDVLRDGDGRPCGIVMANRAGRQAVVAKTIIDATDRAAVARMAGATFRPYTPGVHTFQRIVIGGEVRTEGNMTARLVPPPFPGSNPNRAGTAGGGFDVIEYTLQLHVRDDSYAALADAEQRARSMTYHPDQQFTSDTLFEIPPDPMHGREASAGDWQGVEALPLGAFQPADMPGIYVLGGCADVSRGQAEKLLRPLAWMAMGTRIGKAAARDAKGTPKVAGAKLPAKPSLGPILDARIMETLGGVRPNQQLPTLQQDARALPILGEYDVVVIGGGTGGAPAGISAARTGARTLVVEYLHGLGGVGTLGAISKYYWGNRTGFSASVAGGGAWIIEQKMEWWREQLLQAGGELWFGTIGCGAVMQGDRVIGAVVTTPQGRGVVLAKVVIDATGNADIAAAAGAETIYTDATEFGMQGTGLPGRKLGGTYNNTDFTITDETDMVDVWQLFVHAKGKYPDAFDQGRLIDTRERRRIVGDYTVNILDQINERTYPDSVVRAWSNFDTHGYTTDPYLVLEHPEKKGIGVYIPYRCMLPKGLEGILVIGLGISAERDAVPLIRMQPDIQNGGYAAGVAAAMAVADDVVPRKIDVRALQNHLVEVGNLPSSVLSDKDSYPLPDATIRAAVSNFSSSGKGASVIMANPDRALPLLKVALAAAKDPAGKLAYAKALSVLRDSTGLETIIAEVRNTEQWDQGWNYRGMGQFGSAMSPLDNLIVAMGRTGDARALPTIIEKIELLTAEHDFSHHRAVALALEMIADRSAAKPLADLLAKPGMAGHAHHSIGDAQAREVPGGTTAVQTRRESLRELMLARALYRCGDREGLGRKTLEAYTNDLRGHLARHAEAVLKQ